MDGTGDGDTGTGVAGTPGTVPVAAGAGAGDTPAGGALLAGLAPGGLGRYSGPGWPQPPNKTVRHRVAVPINKRNEDFTIKSWIDDR